MLFQMKIICLLLIYSAKSIIIKLYISENSHTQTHIYTHTNILFKWNTISEYLEVLFILNISIHKIQNKMKKEKKKTKSALQNVFFDADNENLNYKNGNKKL